jgi:large subunit ribosomal protein L24
VKKGEPVEVIPGKDRGVRALNIKALTKEGMVVVEGFAVAKKHQWPAQYREQGGIVDKPMPIDVSNVQLVCPKCEKATRIGHAFDEAGKKYRVCKKCGHQF